MPDLEPLIALDKINTEFYPPNIFGYERLAVALEAGGSFQEAEKAYRRAAEIGKKISHNRTMFYLEKADEMKGKIGQE